MVKHKVNTSECIHRITCRYAKLPDCSCKCPHYESKAITNADYNKLIGYYHLISNDVMNLLCSDKLSLYETKVLLCIVKSNRGDKSKLARRITMDKFREQTGLKGTHIKSCIESLSDKCIIRTFEHSQYMIDLS